MQAVYAQEAPAPATAEAPITKVEVTGSRIPTANLEGTSPITTLYAKDIKIDGVKNTESLMNNLPQVFAAQGASVSNGSTGTAQVNLRGLGAVRTLVLVNGKRMPSGSPTTASPDLNEIPVGLIKRVEVLTGGAGAVYGSDAVAGVVNFIMNDKFEGLQLEVNDSGYNHKQHNALASVVAGRNFPLPGNITYDNKSFDVSILGGGNFANGKGNATIYGSFKRDDGLLESERDFSACTIGSAGAQFNCSGSGTSYPGQFQIQKNALVAAHTVTVADANGTTRPFVTADQYNFGPLNYFQRPSDRYIASASVNYEISEKAKIYSTLAFHDDHTVAQIAPSGLFGGVIFPIHIENPLLSADWKKQLGLVNPGDTAGVVILRRNVEGGGRQADFRNTSYRGLVGLKGDLGNWNYDIYAQMSKVIYQQTYFNEFSKSKTLLALDVITDPKTGLPVCRTGGSCVPYNPWSLNKITPESLAYIQSNGFQNGYTSQNILSATLAGDLGAYGLKLPTADTGVGVSVGFERRAEKLQLLNDTAFATFDLAGQGGPTNDIVGTYSVKEYFGEINVPLVEKRPFFDLLAVNASYRHSDFSTSQKTDSYGAGIEWAPISAMKFRGTYQRAARAANIRELYLPTGLGLYNNTADPCAGAAPSATLAACQLTGVTAAQYGSIQDNSAKQYNQLTGGNVNLKPETSNSYTLGVVLQPIKNLAVTLDLYSVEVNDVISTAPPATVLAQCIKTGNPVFCKLITRDALGTLWLLPEARIVATNQNLGQWKTAGVDIGVNYNFKLPAYGTLAFGFLGTYLDKFTRQDIPGLGSYDCKGLHGSTCGVPLPEWRHKLRTTWSSPWAFEIAATWRHIDAVNTEASSSSPLLAAAYQEADKTLGARDYLDVAGTWNVTKNIALSAGVNNLFDRDPPITATVAASFGNGNTYPQVYDSLGRKLFVNLTAKF